MKPTLNRTTILKLIVDGIKLLAALEEKQNKQKKKLIEIKKKNWELSFFSHKNVLCNVLNKKCIVTMFTCKDFYE